MPEPDYYLKRGDVGGTLAIVCEDEDGTAVNIDSATVAFRMKGIRQGASTVVDAVVSNDQTTSLPETWGEVSYTWLDGDSALPPGLYLGEFQVTYIDQSVITYPNGGYVLIMVTPDITASGGTS